MNVHRCIKFFQLSGSCREVYRCLGESQTLGILLQNYNSLNTVDIREKSGFNKASMSCSYINSATLIRLIRTTSYLIVRRVNCPFEMYWKNRYN